MMEKRYVLVVSLDSKDTFDRISNASIKEAMDRNETSEAMVDWTLNILIDRSHTD